MNITHNLLQPPPSQAHPECGEGPQERGIASARWNGVGGFPAAARITAPTPYAHRISATAALGEIKTRRFGRVRD
ncbi:unnamed protein product [Boreogadus saida]